MPRVTSVTLVLSVTPPVSISHSILYMQILFFLTAAAYVFRNHCLHLPSVISMWRKTNTIFDCQRILYSIVNEYYIRSPTNTIFDFQRKYLRFSTQVSAIVNASICDRHRNYLRSRSKLTSFLGDLFCVISYGSYLAPLELLPPSWGLRLVYYVSFPLLTKKGIKLRKNRNNFGLQRGSVC